MEFNIKKGIHYTAQQIVEKKDTAAQYGSGLVEVFATPAMIALMENAALNAVLPYLGDEHNTVGFEINVRHMKPTPVGMKVECTATLKEIDGNELADEDREEASRKSIESHSRVIEVAKSKNNIQVLLASMGSLAERYYQKDELDTAEEYAKDALKMARHTGNPAAIDILDTIGKINMKKGNEEI